MLIGLDLDAGSQWARGLGLRLVGLEGEKGCGFWRFFTVYLSGFSLSLFFKVVLKMFTVFVLGSLWFKRFWRVFSGLE